MPVVLAFGDSLTHGARPDCLARHPVADRWPTVLAAETGFQVIAEGLNGRTTAYADPQGPALRAGAEVLPTLLHSHAPLDLVILMLGTNDIMVSEVSARAAGRGMARLVEIVRHHPYWGGVPVPEVLIVAAPPAVAAETGGVGVREIDQTAALAAEYRALAADKGCAFFDAATVARASALDGIHLDAANTRAIGTALAPIVTGLIGG